MKSFKNLTLLYRLLWTHAWLLFMLGLAQFTNPLEHMEIVCLTSIYSENVELPLPLVDVIQSFGTFSPVGTLDYYISVSGLSNHVTQNWNAALYKSAISTLKDLGILFKSIDTRIKSGLGGYTDRSLSMELLISAAFFLPVATLITQLCLHQLSCFWMMMKQNLFIFYQFSSWWHHQVRFREVPLGFQVRAFSALPCSPVFANLD